MYDVKCMFRTLWKNIHKFLNSLIVEDGSNVLCNLGQDAMNVAVHVTEVGS